MNKRRQTLIALGAGLLCAPLSAFAQRQPAGMARIGFLSLESPEAVLALNGFREALRERGYVESRNIQFDIRWAGDRYERLPELANELVKLKVDVIVTYGSTATKFASKATTAIPIVIATASIDPVEAGYAATLSRPGGNITGFVSLMGDLAAKRLELLKEAIPGLRRFGFLVNPDSGGGSNSIKGMELAARTLQLKVHVEEVRSAKDITPAFAAMKKARVSAVFMAPSTMLSAHRMEIINLAAKHRLPVMYPRAELVEAGGLMAYGPNLPDTYRNLAAYVDRILKGTKPGDLPIEQAAKIELVVNMKTAKALGIKIPNTILVRADRIIK